MLAFDETAALVWARLMADGTVSGRPRSALDMIIAAIAAVKCCTVVTANEKDFRGSGPKTEPALATAQRELEEETGLTGG